MALDRLQIIQKECITVSQLLESPLQLSSMNGSCGADNLIKDGNIHRPQLALAGYLEIFVNERVQMFGNTEMYYLKQLEEQERIKAFMNVAQNNISCIVLTNSHELHPELLEIATQHNIAVLQTPQVTTKAIHVLSEYLDDQFAPQGVIHGSFVDVYGVGVLFVGRSGIGKSEIALDLIERGHRLVADDVVMLTRKRDVVLMGTGTSLVKHYMEIRGLGIIDIRQMFGVRAIRFQKRLEIIVELEDWDSEKEYNRTGLDEEPLRFMDVDVSHVRLPIFPGKNITVIAEVIALNYLLRTYGYNAAKEFSSKLKEEIERRASKRTGTVDQRHVSYFQSDEE